MDLLYKPDWEQTKENYKAWWAHEYFGRCAIHVTAPKPGMKTQTPPKLPDKIEDRWLDFDYLAASNDHRLKNTFFGAEAIPVWHPGYPDCDTQPVYLGSNVKLDENTGWVEPFIDEGELTQYDYNKLVIDENNRWWKFGRKIRHLSVKESIGKSIPSNMAFGGCGDTLASIRSSKKLLYDVMDCPDYVREFDQYLMKQWIEIYENSYNITHQGAEGSTCWLALWSPDKYYPTQNDFAYMISPQLFIDIFLPTIEMQTNYLDHSIHHVDGIGNFNHVDALLQLPRLQALQISPGAGKPSALHYIDLLKKVQAKGKNLWISLLPQEVEAALDLLSARGLYIYTSCDSEEEARALIKCCEKWSKDRG